jgi:rhomboid-like protein
MKNASNFALAQVRGFVLPLSPLTRMYQELREDLKTVANSTEWVPAVARNRLMRAWATVAQTYLNVTEGKRLCWKICLLNVGVWLAWKSKRLQPFMLRNFVHDPLSGRSLTMLTSMFRYDNYIRNIQG